MRSYLARIPIDTQGNHEIQQVYTEADILPVLRLAREVAIKCINFQPNYSDPAQELLTILNAMEGVEG